MSTFIALVLLLISSYICLYHVYICYIINEGSNFSPNDELMPSPRDKIRRRRGGSFDLTLKQSLEKPGNIPISLKKIHISSQFTIYAFSGNYELSPRFAFENLDAAPETPYHLEGHSTYKNSQCPYLYHITFLEAFIYVLSLHHQVMPS